MIVAERGGEVLFKERASLSLVHYLEGENLSLSGMEKLAVLLEHMKTVAMAEGAERCYVISTAALRHVRNSKEIASFVKKRTGLSVNYIDEPTEAYCDYLANRGYATLERAVLVDLGGKSIEICDLSKTEKGEMFGFEFGLIDLTRKFVSNIYPSREEGKAMRKFLNKKLDAANVPCEGAFATAVLVGATANAIYDIYADFAKVSGAEQKVMEYARFKKLAKRLLEGADRSRLILKNAPEKVYVLGAALTALKAVFKRFAVENIIVSDHGVKEGYLCLVREGKEKGRYTLLTSANAEDAASAVTVAVDATLPVPAPAPKKRGRPKKVQPQQEGAPAEEKAPKKRREVKTQTQRGDHE